MKLLRILPMLVSVLLAAPAWAVSVGHPAHPDTTVPSFRPADFFLTQPQAAQAAPAAHDHAGLAAAAAAAPAAGKHCQRDGGCCCCKCGDEVREEARASGPDAAKSCGMKRKKPEEAAGVPGGSGDHASHH